MSRRPAIGSLTTTSRAPSRRAHRVTASPMFPPPSTSTLSPALMSPMATVCSPTASGSTNAPSGPMAGSSGTVCAAATRTYSANAPGVAPIPNRSTRAQCAGSSAWHQRHTPHAVSGKAAACWPARHFPRLSAPTATTSPQNSWPSTAPAGSIVCAFRSDPQMPQAFTRRTSSSGSGDGSGTSATSKVCCSVRTAARISVPPHVIAATRRRGR